MKNQESSAEFNGHHEAQKRKWPYSETNSYTSYTVDKGVIAKKSMNSYNYDNFQPNHQYIISTTTNGQEQQNDSNDDGSVNCNQQSTQMLNTMEISENIEYVNILYEDDLLTSIQAPVATETNYINFEPNWGNADILDLDQRNYYYETSNTNTVHLNHMNGQLSQQQNDQETSIHIQQQQQQQHQQMAHSETQSNLQIANNHHIHNVTEYEIVQNVYTDNENGREKSIPNLRKNFVVFFYLYFFFDSMEF